MPYSKVAQIVTLYRICLGMGIHNISYRAFAEKLNRITRIHHLTVSHQSIYNWEQALKLPQEEYLFTLRQSAKPGTWEFYFACELLAAIEPQHYKPLGPIGKNVFQKK